MFGFKYEEMSHEDRIIKAMATMNHVCPFYARIMLNLDRHPLEKNRNIKTMAVNQFGHLYYNIDFVMGLSFEELQGCLAHEACHVAFLTFQRQGNRDHELWNIATDIAINWTIVASKITLPKMAIIPESDGTLDLPLANIKINVSEIPAEKIYELLEKQAEKVKLHYKSYDEHLPSNKDGNGNGEEPSPTEIEMNSHKWTQVFSNAVAYAKQKGSGVASIERILDSILRPKLDWREILNRYITRELPFNQTYSRPNKRSQAVGFYMPHSVNEGLNVVITCDVSGSIGQDEYREFISEVCGICTAFNSVNARLLFWSTYIDPKDDKILDRDMVYDLKSYVPHASGGTHMSCVADYMQKNNINSSVNIHLTDGEVEENPKLPKGVNIVVISSKGRDSILSKTDAIVCSLGDRR